MGGHFTRAALRRGDTLRAVITGAAGFAGSHLVEHLSTHTDLQLFGIVRERGKISDPTHLEGLMAIREGDILSLEFVQSMVREIKPDYLFHLAAQAAPSQSWGDPNQTFVNNVLGQMNVLRAIAAESPRCRVLVVGSGDEYGIVEPSELPVREDNPLRPNNPYAVSKIAQDMLGLQYFLSHRLQIVRVRPFNHIGPRQGGAFVCSSFARQIVEAELGLREPVVKVGNLDARRDFTDVRDIVRAYWLALSHGQPGEVYNLGSGTAFAISDILRSLLEKSHTKIRVEQDPTRLRPSDVPVVYCDYRKFHLLTGWKPKFPLEESLAELLDYWRGVLRELRTIDKPLSKQ